MKPDKTNDAQLSEAIGKLVSDSQVALTDSFGQSGSLAASQKLVTHANDNANSRLDKAQNGADIPDKNTFINNLGLRDTVNQVKNAVPTSRKINNKPLTGDITLMAGDVHAYPTPAYSDGLPSDNYIGPFLGGPSVGWAKGVSIGTRGGDIGQIWIDSGATLHTRYLNKGNGVTQQRIVSIPIGAIIEWQSEASIPDGFMENNGREFDKTRYPDLSKVFPSGRLPDDRGLFKRGLDTMGGVSRGLDPGRKLGTVQDDAIRNITGGFGSPTTEGGNFGDGAFSVKVGYGGRQAGAGGNYVSYRFDASRVVPTANENRPVNKSVIYITRVF
ncbi:phage tail protein [Xenorhabdus budapestensis]